MSARPKYAWDTKRTLPLAVVQSAANAYNPTTTNKPTITFAAPNPGSLCIILAAVRDDAAPSPAAGWTEDATNRIHSASTGQYVTVYYRYALAGDPTTVQFDTVNRHQWCAHFWEIQGLTGVYATDVVDFNFNAAALVDGNYPYNSGSFNAGHNEIILAAAFQQGPSLAAIAVAGVTADGAADPNQADGFGSFDAVAGGHKAVNNGDAVQITASGGPNGSFAEYAILGVGPH